MLIVMLPKTCWPIIIALIDFLEINKTITIYMKEK